MTPAQKAQEIITRLSQQWPDPKVELDFTSPWELLVATVLAAQCTDKQVNKTTPALFGAYPTIESMAKASPETIDKLIASITFHKNKSGYIVKSAQMIMEKFDGKVPQTMDELVSLPGVARKTANVVLGDAFGKNEGIIVDTHVKRLAQQLGLTQHKDPVKIEQDLMKIAPQKDWIRFSHLLTLFGRYKCPARKNVKDNQVLGDLC